jgi:hypothetical protein
MLAEIGAHMRLGAEQTEKFLQQPPRSKPSKEK